MLPRIGYEVPLLEPPAPWLPLRTREIWLAKAKLLTAVAQSERWAMAAPIAEMAGNHHFDCRVAISNFRRLFAPRKHPIAPRERLFEPNAYERRSNRKRAGSRSMLSGVKRRAASRSLSFRAPASRIAGGCSGSL